MVPIILSWLNLNLSHHTPQTITISNVYKYLGITINSKLCFTVHHQKVITNATWWTFQISRLLRITRGIPPKWMCQFYNTVAVPAFTYAANIWFTPLCPLPNSTKQTGSVAVVKHLIPSQCKAAKLITSALNTTVSDVLQVDVHANLLPVDLLFDKILFCSTVRLSSLPPSHPLYRPVWKATKHYITHHCSPLHNLFLPFNLDPLNIETVTPTWCRPNFQPLISSTPLQDKDAALANALHTHKNSTFSVYCNRSGYEGSIGAATVLYINSIELSHLLYHLDPETDHTVYEGEWVGLNLALHLLSLLCIILYPKVAIGTNNQAAIKALTNQCNAPTLPTTFLTGSMTQQKNSGKSKPSSETSPSPLLLMLHHNSPSPHCDNGPLDSRAFQLCI